MSTYRSVHVQVHLGKRKAWVAVIARTTSGGHRRESLLHRAAVDVPAVESVEHILRAAAAELLRAADEL